MGTLPIAIGVGASAASRRPLGVAVVGGLAFSQIVTLYVTPVFYTYLDELQALARARRASAISTTGPHGAGRPLRAVPLAGELTVDFTTLFIKRPVMTTLVMIGILFFGIVAYRELPVSDLPNVDFPTITVTATLPGASPETMAATVATPLEKAVLDDRRHRQHDVDVEPRADADRRAVRARPQHRRRRAGRAGRDRADAAPLPQGIIPPSYQKTNPADAPILTLALTSTQVPLSTLDEYGETTIAQRLSMVGGVAQVLVYGTQKYAVRLQLDPAQLATRSIGLEDVDDGDHQPERQSCPPACSGARRPRSRSRRPASSTTPAEFRRHDRRLPQRRAGAAQRLGRITDDVQNNKTASWYNGEPRDRARDPAPARHQHRRGREPRQGGAGQAADGDPAVGARRTCCTTGRRRSRRRCDDVKFTLELTLVLVVLVIFLFLRNVSATIIPSLALPMSIIGTFSVMYLLNYSLDNLSLMALTLAVGFVVDDAIVMLENIVRHLEMGKPKIQAAIDGAAEVGFTILSMTLLAGRGVHPDPVHGRDHRQAVPRVRGHDRRRRFSCPASCRSR